jgi:caa(3)-type oxidase subunit IV
LADTTHHSHKKEYILVFIALGVLTVLELIIPEIDTSYALKASSLSILALGKAFLVAYYFMHLKEETKWLQFIALLPVFAFMYATFVVIESVVR